MTILTRSLGGMILLLLTLVPFSAHSASETGLALPAGIVPGSRLAPEDCLPKDPPPPVVKIKVRVPACSDPGESIKYHICVENCSSAEAHHVLVKNTLPANVKFVRADPEPAKTGTELQWKLGTIGGGATREITLVLQPTNKEDVKNCLRVVFEHGQCVVTRQAASLLHPGLPPIITDPTQPGVKPPVIETVPDEKRLNQPELDLVIRGPRQQYTNLSSKYEITVTNKGKVKATNTQVNVRLPDKLKVVKASDSGAAVENVVAWNLGPLEPGASRALELILQAKEMGEFCFKATAVADQGVKKEAEFCTKFAGVSAMTLELTDTVDPVFIGYKTSYLIQIRNQGSVPLTNIRLKAYIPDALKIEKAVPTFEKKETVKGGQWIEFKSLPSIEVSYTAKYEIFVEAALAGITRVHVEVLADQLDSGPVREQELTTIVDDREPFKVKELSRSRHHP